MCKSGSNEAALTAEDGGSDMEEGAASGFGAIFLNGNSFAVRRRRSKEAAEGCSKDELVDSVGAGAKGVFGYRYSSNLVQSKFLNRCNLIPNRHSNVRTGLGREGPKDGPACLFRLFFRHFHFSMHCIRFTMHYGTAMVILCDSLKRIRYFWSCIVCMCS